MFFYVVYSFIYKWKYLYFIYTMIGLFKDIGIIQIEIYLDFLYKKYDKMNKLTVQFYT